MSAATPFAALGHRNFRYFIIGQFISLSGTWMQSIALGWLVLEMTDSAFAVGLVSALGALPILLFTLQGGAVADRVNRHRMLMVLQAGMMLEAAALTVLAWTGHATLFWIILLALLHGTFAAFEIPIRQTFLMDLVGKDTLMNAIAMNSMAFNASRVIGPALAGVITAAAGPAVCFAANTMSYSAVLFGLFRIRPDPALAAPRRIAPPLQEALRYLFAPGWPRALVTLATIYTIFGISFIAVLPAYARDGLGTGAGGYGALTSAFGVGAASGALLLAAFGTRLRRGTIALRAGALLGGSLIVVSLADAVPVAFLMVLAGGAAAAVTSIITNTLLQTEAPDHLRSRVIGIYAFIVVGLAPIGSFQAGLVAEHLGSRAQAAIGGVICLIAAVWTLSRTGRSARTGEERRRWRRPGSFQRGGTGT